jgi:ribosomal protein L2
MNFNHKKKFLLENFNYKLVKKGVTSGGSRLSFAIKRKLPMEIKSKKLSLTISNTAGRGSSGRIVVYTKRSRLFKKTSTSINYAFRLRFISFVGAVSILPFTHKIVSTLFLSTGGITYVPATHKQSLFKFARMYNLKDDMLDMRERYILNGTAYFISQGFFLIKDLPRNQPVSLLETVPGVGAKYVRSPSVSARITKMEFKSNTALVRLPSGVRKVFSVFSIGSMGPNPLLENKY